MRHATLLELASRDVVSRAEQTEINEGRGVGTDGSGIYLDITVVPKKRTLEALREIVNIGKDFAGVDITKEPILIRPGQHYIMGGVKTDIDGATPVSAPTMMMSVAASLGSLKYSWRSTHTRAESPGWSRSAW